MLSPELEHILQLLYREARNARYEFISLEHLLFGADRRRCSCAERLKIVWCGFESPVRAACRQRC